VQVSRFYGSDNLSPATLEPLNYEIISPVKYKAAGGDKKYTIFVPPNLDPSDSPLDGAEARWLLRSVAEPRWKTGVLPIYDI
jgi:hypothetical protein